MLSTFENITAVSDLLCLLAFKDWKQNILTFFCHTLQKARGHIQKL